MRVYRSCAERSAERLDATMIATAAAPRVPPTKKPRTKPMINCTREELYVLCGRSRGRRTYRGWRSGPAGSSRRDVFHSPRLGGEAYALGKCPGRRSINTSIKLGGTERIGEWSSRKLLTWSSRSMARTC